MIYYDQHSGLNSVRIKAGCNILLILLTVIFMSCNHSDVKDAIVIGGHLKRGEILSLDKVWQKGLTSEVREWGLNMTLNYLQQLNIPVLKSDLQYVDGFSCVYSLTASEVPFVTNILDEENQADPNFIVLARISHQEIFSSVRRR